MKQMHDGSKGAEEARAKQPLPFNAQNITLWLQDFKKKCENNMSENSKINKLISALNA